MKNFDQNFLHAFVGQDPLVEKRNFFWSDSACVSIKLRFAIDREAAFPDADFPGDDFPGDDFSGDDFPGDDFPGDDFPYADFPGDDFPGDDYPYDDILHADFAEGVFLCAATYLSTCFWLFPYIFFSRVIFPNHETLGVNCR